MEATKVQERATKKMRWPWVAAIILVLAAAAVLCYVLWPRPLVTASAYVAADLESVEIYNEEGAVSDKLIRGSTVTYVVEEEDEERPGLIRLVMTGAEAEEIFEDEATFAWIEKAHLTDDPAKVVQTEVMYVRTAVNLTDETGAEAGELVDKGEALQGVGFDGLDEEGKSLQRLMWPPF